MLTGYAQGQGIVGLHFWSLDRDTPCSGGGGTASPICNSVSGSTPLQYTNRFLQNLGQ